MSDPKIKSLEEIIEGDFIKGKFAVRTKETPREYKNKSGKYFFLNVGVRFPSNTGEARRIRPSWNSTIPSRLGMSLK
jgi:hypothetical protein